MRGVIADLGNVVCEVAVASRLTRAGQAANRANAVGTRLGAVVKAVVAHNKVTGYGSVGCANLFYDKDAESGAVTRRNHRLLRLTGNLLPQGNTKGDLFVGINQANTAEAPYRAGQLALCHGVGCQGNWAQYVDAGGGSDAGGGGGPVFGQFYPGHGCKIGAPPRRRWPRRPRSGRTTGALGPAAERRWPASGEAFISSRRILPRAAW